MKTGKCAALVAAMCVFFAVLTGCGAVAPEREETAAEAAVSAARSYAGLLPPEGAPSREAVESIADAVAALGYPTADYAGELAFRNPELIENYFSDGGDEPLTLIRICSDGSLLLTRIGADTVENVRVAFESGEPSVTYSTAYPLLYLKLTEKGWLIWTEDIPDNTGTEHDGYIQPTTMLRLTPADAGLAALCSEYVEAVGYDDCGLFMRDWTAEDMSAVDFAEVFPILYRAKYGEPLTEYGSPYPADASTGGLIVPESDFEELAEDYFGVGAEYLRSMPEYDTDRGAYTVTLAGVPESGQPRFTPECVSCRVNGDGTLTLRVDALCAAMATDRAFSHELTVAVGEDGFRYVSNRYFAGESGN